MTFRQTMAGAVAASTLLGAGVAQAAPNTDQPLPDALERSYVKHYDRVEKLGGDPGRNLVDDGVHTRDGRGRAAGPGEIRRSLRVLVRMEHGLTAPAPSVTASASAATSTPAASAGGSLDSIAACESGGDPSAVGGGGAYRGKYQFDQQTWESVGGSGDPAAAPEAEQDARAAQLYAQRGASAWPVCGR